MIARIQHDIASEKCIGILKLDEEVDNLYDKVEEFLKLNNVDVLLIEGIEKSLLRYIKPGYGGQGNYYSLDTIPRVLGKLNLQRERFRDSFKICFVFFVPLFALKYFIQRAPDFYDWRSGTWEFVDKKETSERSTEVIAEGYYQKYLSLSPDQRRQKNLEFEELIDTNKDPKVKSEVLVQQGVLSHVERKYEDAIAIYKEALALDPDNVWGWYNCGTALAALGNYREAIVSYNKALEIDSTIS